MKKVYEAWSEGEGERWEAMTLGPPDVVSEMKERGHIGRSAVLRFRIEADTIEEAKAVNTSRWAGLHFSPMEKLLRAQISEVPSITLTAPESAQTAARSTDSAPTSAFAPANPPVIGIDFTQNNSTRAECPGTEESRLLRLISGAPRSSASAR